MYKVNFAQHLIDFTGQPMNGMAVRCQNCGGAARLDTVTLRSVCLNALDHQGGPVRAEEKFERFRLALQIQQRDEMELTASEIALLKELIGQKYRSWIMGQAWEMLEPSGKAENGEGEG